MAAGWAVVVGGIMAAMFPPLSMTRRRPWTRLSICLSSKGQSLKIERHWRWFRKPRVRPVSAARDSRFLKSFSFWNWRRRLEINWFRSGAELGA